MGECLRIVIPVVESRGGTVLRAFASHQCSSGLNPGLGVISRLCLLLVFVLALLFISGLCGFTYSLHKNQHSKFYNEFNRALLCFLRAELLLFYYTDLYFVSIWKIFLDKCSMPLAA